MKRRNLFSLLFIAATLGLMIALADDGGAETACAGAMAFGEEEIGTALRANPRDLDVLLWYSQVQQQPAVRLPQVKVRAPISSV